MAQDHRTGARDQRIVAVGLGVNVAASPVGLRYSATSLARRGRAVTADELFEALSEAWLAFHRLWDHGRGMPQIRALWLEAAAGVGEPIAVRLGDEAARGVFETIDTSGQLILRSSDGTVRAIAAGEVHFGAAATAWEVA